MVMGDRLTDGRHRQDHMEPTLEAVEAAVDFIKEKRDSGVRVYVHCKGGNGRSAAVAFCWLLFSRGWDLKETQEYLSDKRRVRAKLFQQPVVVEYYRKLQTTRGDKDHE
jgi:protein-tyrosine phosphatase